MWLRSLAVWVLLMAAEVVHGILRGILIVPLVGDFRARQIGVFIGSLLILFIAYGCIRWMNPSRSSRRLLRVGLVWVALTLVFEIGLGRVALDYRWERVLSDYNLAGGGLMPLGLIVLGASPWIANRLRS